jgi:hypothetical protein
MNTKVEHSMHKSSFVKEAIAIYLPTYNVGNTGMT